MTAPQSLPAHVVADARRRTAELRESLLTADALLLQAWRDRLWLALGHPDWETYCQVELPELRMIKLSPPARLERVTVWVDAGASVRAIGSACGVGKSQASRDVAAVRAARRALVAGQEPGTVTSLDGRRRPATRPPAPAPTPAPVPASPAPGVSWIAARAGVGQDARTLALVASCGRRGATVKELASELGWTQTQASASLSRLAARRSIVVNGRRRARCNAYIINPEQETTP